MLKSKKINKSKIKKVIEFFLLCLVGILLALSLLMLKEYFELRNNKLLIMKDDILGSYYNKDNIKKVLKKNLGDKYKGNLEEDFENYIVTTVLEDLSNLEEGRWKKYNSFKTKKWMDEFTEVRQETANGLTGREINNKIYYINIKGFYDGITYEKFYSHMDQLKSHKNLIIDLRDNSGGNFKDMKKIADLLLEKNQIIYKLNSSKGTENIYSESEKKLDFNNIVILTNRNTASVSELFILALKGNLNNVSTVGVNTYGKSISYAIRKFKDDSAMLFITNKMEGPNSEKINITGIKPDVRVGHSNKYYESIKDINKEKIVRDQDKKQQIDKAIEYIESF